MSSAHHQEANHSDSERVSDNEGNTSEQGQEHDRADAYGGVADDHHRHVTAITPEMLPQTGLMTFLAAWTRTKKAAPRAVPKGVRHAVTVIKAAAKAMSATRPLLDATSVQR